MLGTKREHPLHCAILISCVITLQKYDDKMGNIWACIKLRGCAEDVLCPGCVWKKVEVWGVTADIIEMIVLGGWLVLRDEGT